MSQYNIQSIPNFLSNELIEKVRGYVCNSGWHYGNTSNYNLGYAHWSKSFANAIMTNGLDLSSQLAEPILETWKHLQTNHAPNARLIRCYANAHTYGLEGYLHTDSRRQHDRTAILYLNRKWLLEWNGETAIIANGNIIHSEVPRYNNLLIFPGKMFHQAKPISRICPDLRVTLMFKFSTVEDHLRDRLQLFLEKNDFNKKIIGNHTLITHSLNVYDLLKSAGQSDIVCAAGSMIEIPVTSEVTSIIGDLSTELLYLFKNQGSVESLESSINISNRDLCFIQSARLHDLRQLKNYPNLEKFWKQNDL